jgi:hypothetical protein
LSSQIQWAIFLRIKAKDKARVLLDRIAQAIDQPTTVSECERYWKDESLFRATLTSPLPYPDSSTAILYTLQCCWRLGRKWWISAPEFYADQNWEFAGASDDRMLLVNGVAHIDFQAGNIEVAVPALALPSSDKRHS